MKNTKDGERIKRISSRLSELGDIAVQLNLRIENLQELVNTGKNAFLYGEGSSTRSFQITLDHKYAGGNERTQAYLVGEDLRFVAMVFLRDARETLKKATDEYAELTTELSTLK